MTYEGSHVGGGIGARLGFARNEQSAKILLRFGGKSLLQYHIEILQRQGADELILGVGYHHQDIDQEIAALVAQDFVRTVFNENYEEGNIVTLWELRDELDCGEPVLLMDADVLYDDHLITRLINTRHQNCFLLDRDFDSGDEPVKLCVRDVLLTSPRDTFSFEDITGMAWIEFDFAADIERANTKILPRILSSIDNRGKTVIIRQTPDQVEKRIQ